MFQPLYGKMSDNASSTEQHTSSRRGTVTSVYAEILSHFGEVLNVDCHSQGNLEKKDVFECEQKILHWSDKGNIKKVTAWQRKKDERVKFNKEQEDKEEVVVRLDLKTSNEKMIFNINGTMVDQKMLNMLSNKLAIQKYKEIIKQQEIEEAL